MSLQIRLRRHNTSTPWGFRLNGGTEFNQPLFIQRVCNFNKFSGITLKIYWPFIQVTPQSIAEKCGLAPGDGVIQIGSVLTDGLTHEEAKMEIIRSGNDLDFTIQR